MDAHALFGRAAFGDDRITMDAEHAWVMAARLRLLTGAVDGHAGVAAEVG
jgi:hypothetical protein